MPTEKQSREEVFGRLISMKRCATDVSSKSNPEMIGPLVYDMGVLLSNLSELSELSSRRLERQTQQIIYLTWALVAFTSVLVILTLVLIKHGYKLYQKAKHDQQEYEYWI